MKKYKKVIPISISEIDSLSDFFYSKGKSLIFLSNLTRETHDILKNTEILKELSLSGLIPNSRLVLKKEQNENFYLEIDARIVPRRIREMPANLIKDACEILIKVSKILDSFNLILNTFHESQIALDDKSRPVFVGFKNIINKSANRFAFQDYTKYWLGPLIAHSKYNELAPFIRRANHIDRKDIILMSHPLLNAIYSSLNKNSYTSEVANLIKRILFNSPYSQLIFNSQYLRLLNIMLRDILRRKRGQTLSNDWIEISLDVLLKRINKICISSSNERWSEYHTDYHLNDIIDNDTPDWESWYSGTRPKEILNFLKNCEPSSVLDLGANQGYFSIMSAKLGHQVTALDYDGSAINQLYLMLKDKNFKLSITPGIFDFTKFNFDNFDRFYSDITLALGFTHHMRLVELLPWRKICEILSRLTKKLLITEFKDGTKARAHFFQDDKDVVNDYNLDAFVRELRLCFNEVLVIEGLSQNTNAPVRHLIVCKK